jgi:peptidoglycan hydrolase-like protein with peptidoglycan-binding domain
MTADRAAGRRRRRVAAIAAPIVAAGVTAGIVLSGPPGRPAHPAGAAVTLGSAPVVRTNLENTIQVGGSLGYAGSYTIVNQTAGTAYTALPAPGATIRRGEALYEVDGTPVTLFYGATPEWRALSVGVAPGRDVAQLDRNMIALGYGAGLVISDYFTGSTAYAVELWQAARGLPVTGTVPLGQVAYAPGPLRITGVTPVLGSPPQPGTSALTATSPVPVVIGEVPVGQEYLVKTGDTVTVTLPDGVTTTPGVIASVASVASAGNSGAAPQPSPGASSESGTSQDTVQITVRLTHPEAAGHLDQAPVSVNIVSAQARDVLAVPVSALVALAGQGNGETGGGYAVDVVQGSAVHLIAVQTGLFSQTLVQVSGAGLAAGMNVEVPSS